MKKNIFIIVLIIIILCLGGYLVYDKVIDKDDNNVNNVVTENNKEETDEQIIENIEVIDYIKISFDRETIKSNFDQICCSGTCPTDVISIPMINSNRKGAKKMNEMIQKNLKDRINYAKLTLDEKIEYFKNHSLSSSYSVGYDYSTFNDYISIRIYDAVGGCQTIIPEQYIYNINEDRLVANEEKLSIFNISRKEIKEKANELIDEDEIYNGNTRNIVIQNMELGNYSIFLTEEGKLEIIINTGMIIPIILIFD